MTIAGLEIIQTFHILDGMAIPCILGMDFINEHHVILDFLRQQLILYDGLAATPLCHDTQYPEAVIDTLVHLPACTETILALKVNSPVPISGPVLLEPRQQFADAWKVLPARFIAYIQNKRLAVKILNPTNEDLTLCPWHCGGIPRTNPENHR